MLKGVRVVAVEYPYRALRGLLNKMADKELYI